MTAVSIREGPLITEQGIERKVIGVAVPPTDNPHRNPRVREAVEDVIEDRDEAATVGDWSDIEGEDDGAAEQLTIAFDGVGNVDTESLVSEFRDDVTDVLEPRTFDRDHGTDNGGPVGEHRHARGHAAGGDDQRIGEGRHPRGHGTDNGGPVGEHRHARGYAAGEGGGEDTDE